jgi:uncharacterized membrane protein YdjX (TVP38/TMEM64 family)
MMSFFKNLFLHNRQTVLYLTAIFIVQLVCTTLFGSIIFQDSQYFAPFTWLVCLKIYAIFAIFMAFSILPNSFIAFFGAFFLGFVAIIPFSISYIFALILGFVIAKKIDRGNFSKSLQTYPKIKQFLEALQDNEILLVLTARFSPIFPFALMNQILYSTKVNFTTYLWASVLGMLPRALLMTYIGAEAASLTDFSKGNMTEKAIQFCLLLVSIFVFTLVIRKARKKMETMQKKNEQNELL